MTSDSASSPDCHSLQGRRSFLKHTAAVTAVGGSAAAFPGICAGSDARPAVPRILDTRVISQQPHLYHGWPTITRRTNGELWVVWSGGREEHVCPFGQLCAMTSQDDGETWTWPRVLLDSATDDRDAGIVETAAGTLLATTFTSLAFEDRLTRAEKDPGSWDPDRLARWQAARDRLSPAERRSELGEWLIRSTDGGRTWSERLPSIVNSPHGPVVLSNGRLLYAGKQLWSNNGRIGVVESTDDGVSWHWLAEIPVRQGDDAHRDYHELHLVEAANGSLIVQIRNEGAANENETLQSESLDGGKTWSVPHAIGVWGLPSHLLRMRDGRLVMSYGYRRAPFGNQARISTDNGATWSDPVTLSDDGIHADLGYPSTVQLADDTLLSVWYEVRKDQPFAVLRQARWQA
jgi:hypothetical protein